MTSRYYRAPELMMGNKKYTSNIDIWSTGCVIAELVLGEPLFKGSNHKSQLLEIVKILGTPNENEVIAMNPDHKNKRLPKLVG
jgi:serine/threonine protein kinase